MREHACSTRPPIAPSTRGGPSCQGLSEGLLLAASKRIFFFRPIPIPSAEPFCLTAHTVSLKSAVRVHLRLSDRDVSVPPTRPPGAMGSFCDGSPSAHAFRVFLSNLSFSSPLLALLSAGEGKRERGPALPSFKAESYCTRLRWK
jgi:hypothetical protein